MTYYVVKETSKATDENLSFKGETRIDYYGKQINLIAWECDPFRPGESPLEDNAFMVKLYGYKTKRGAKRNYAYTHPENNKFWQSVTEVIAVEIVNGKVMEVKR